MHGVASAAIALQGAGRFVVPSAFSGRTTHPIPSAHHRRTRSRGRGGSIRQASAGPDRARPAVRWSVSPWGRRSRRSRCPGSGAAATRWRPRDRARGAGRRPGEARAEGQRDDLRGLGAGLVADVVDIAPPRPDAVHVRHRNGVADVPSAARQGISAAPSTTLVWSCPGAPSARPGSARAVASRWARACRSGPSPGPIPRRTGPAPTRSRCRGPRSWAPGATQAGSSRATCRRGPAAARVPIDRRPGQRATGSGRVRCPAARTPRTRPNRALREDVPVGRSDEEFGATDGDLVGQHALLRVGAAKPRREVEEGVTVGGDVERGPRLGVRGRREAGLPAVLLRRIHRPDRRQCPLLELRDRTVVQRGDLRKYLLPNLLDEGLRIAGPPIAAPRARSA